MDEKGLKKSDVMALLAQAHVLDLSYRGGRILGSMCTAPHPIGIEAFTSFLETNLGDSGLFQGTRGLEEEVVRMIGELQGGDWAAGRVVTGGTEANIMALWSARNLTRKKEVLAPESVHFSIDKACNLLGLKLVKAGLKESNQVDLGEVEERINKETSCLIGIGGTTEHGVVDDIKGLSDIALEHDIPLHVDAAFGGFVLPFLKDLGYPVEWDLSLEGISSVTVDPHKMGLVPIPCGTILFRDKSALRSIEIEAPYLTKKRQHTLVGTRSGASTAAAYAVLKNLGREGYRKVVGSSMENTLYLYEELNKRGYTVQKPVTNIIVFKADKDIIMRLSGAGWNLSQTCQGDIRIVLMPHVTRQVLDDFLKELDRNVRS